MTHQHRLSLYLAALLGPLPLAGCAPELDDEACLEVELGASCPTDAVAAEELIGRTTCEDPVREVIATGSLLYSEEVVGTGYGGYEPYDPADTGEHFFDPVTRCCYEAAYDVIPGMSCVPGRPLRQQGRALLAGVSAGAACAPASELSTAARRRLARAWLRDARMEHASIPAFARLAAELEQLEAPPELVARARVAEAQERVHAREAFALASRYAGRQLRPEPYPAVPAREPELRRLAVECLVEGLAGETLAVARAALQLRHSDDPQVRAALIRVLRDESSHAQLAADVLAWALRSGDATLREAVQAALAELRVQPMSGRENPWAEGLPVGGELQALLARTLEEVVRPSAEALLAA